jgi:hypothetical protein
MGNERVGALSVLLIASFLGGCSPADDQPPRVPERVRLNVTAPSDNAVVRRDAVQLRGRVRPASADVEVLGESVSVAADGAFTTSIPLDVGANVVDVLASSGRRRPAMAAIRVTRQVPVRVPDLRGTSTDEARDRLAALGLRPRIEERGGSILDDLLPIDTVVCSTDPDTGTEVTGGTAVVVVVSKLC